jgi:murein DD-endopeptidase MepM/ murein hydrolase activator NlpD
MGRNNPEAVSSEANRMNLILFLHRGGKAWRVSLTQPAMLLALGAGVLSLLAAVFGLGMQLGERTGLPLAADAPLEWTRTFSRQQSEIAELREQLQQRVDALAARVGQVNAHVIRLDALGKRLTTMANIDEREFNFDSLPAAGGPDERAERSAQVLELTDMIKAAEERVMLREGQLTALENVILSRELREQILPDGRPVRKGFISSYYGERQDPFSGHQAFHSGVDFAGSMGDDVIAVAAGLVTYTGDRSGYGAVVEITHGNGYVTRYAHNRQNLVKLGQVVQRGDVLARMGSSGRSTGPHVHFEVMRNGQQINPLSYIGD